MCARLAEWRHHLLFEACLCLGDDVLFWLWLLRCDQFIDHFVERHLLDGWFLFDTEEVLISDFVELFNFADTANLFFEELDFYLHLVNHFLMIELRFFDVCVFLAYHVFIFFLYEIDLGLEIASFNALLPFALFEVEDLS